MEDCYTHSTHNMFKTKTSNWIHISEKRLHVVKARICRDLFTQTFNQSGQNQQSDDTAGKKGIEVRVQKIKKSLKACTSFSRKTNIVRFIVNHVEIYTLLKTGGLMFPGGCKKKITMKKQFIVWMCDFEFELKFLRMHLIYQFLINGNISGVRSVDIVIKMLLVLYFCLIPCFLVFCMILHLQLFFFFKRLKFNSRFRLYTA